MAIPGQPPRDAGMGPRLPPGGPPAPPGPGGGIPPYFQGGGSGPFGGGGTPSGGSAGSPGLLAASMPPVDATFLQAVTRFNIAEALAQAAGASPHAIAQGIQFLEQRAAAAMSPEFQAALGAAIQQLILRTGSS